MYKYYVVDKFTNKEIIEFERPYLIEEIFISIDNKIYKARFMQEDCEKTCNIYLATEVRGIVF